MDPSLPRDIFQLKNQDTFREYALEVFHYQAEQNPVYREYLQTLKVDPGSINELEEIPFLPIEFFKTHPVLCEGSGTELLFESSGTTGMVPSRHHVADAALYRKSFVEGFRHFYGDPARLCILALLPSYLERSGSSLVYMMEHLISLSAHPDSGFYLHNLGDLATMLERRSKDGVPTLLMGVSFALLDLAEQFPLELPDNIIVMETGGMKGTRKELVRHELHSILKQAFAVESIHSEYGMTELLSQAYSRGGGVFHAPPWMKVVARDANDPLSPAGPGQSGGLNIVDLANLYSCSFVATGDLGIVYENGSFEVLGRFDHAEIRGCNLLVS